MIIDWPQGIWLGLTLVGLGVKAALHGKPQDDHNFFISAIATAMVAAVLWWGGFFG